MSRLTSSPVGAPSVSVAAMAGLAVILVLAMAATGSGRASAEVPAAAFSGSVPQRGGAALLVAGENATPEALVSALQSGGCDPIALAVGAGGEWKMYVPGAPPVVNADFPATIEPSSPFTARCEAVAESALDIAGVTITVDGFTFTLENGRDEQPIVPGAATVAVAQLAGYNAYGDLDGDGLTDAAFILISSPGGSGTFSYVSALTADGVVLDPILLGDRISVRRIEIVAGEVRIAYLTRRGDEPLATAPTVPTDRSLVRDVGALVPVGCATQSAGGANSLVSVTSPASGALFPSGSTVEGCSRTFESTVNWELYDRAGVRLASGFASGGGVDGRAPFSIFVSYTVADEQVGRLELFAVDVSGGEGFPPPRDVVPVVLTPGPDVVQLAASSWRMTTISGAAVLAGTEVTAEFLAGTVSGSSGCNSYTGSYEAAGGMLVFPSPFAATKMACEQAVMDQEQAFLAALTGATSFSIDGDALTIQTAAGEVVFTAVTPLTQSEWMLTSLAGANPVSGTTVTANFAAGAANGSSGCNSYASGYEVNGSVLNFPSPFVVTAMACEQAVMDQEQAFLTALAGATSFSISGDALTIQTATGELIFGAISPLTQNGWTLTSLVGTSLVSGTTVTANFAAGAVTGSSGCNSYASGYEVSGSTLDFPSPFAVTAMACVQAVMDQEQTYLSALAGATTVVVDGGTLTIEGATGELVFVKDDGS